MSQATLSPTDTTGLFLDNARRAGGGSSLALVDPSTGEEFARLASATAADVETALASAHTAFGTWKGTSPVERGRFCARVATLLLERAESLAAISVQDAGLPRTLALRDIEAAARYFEFYSGVPDKLHGESIPVGADGVDFTIREPWGVCAIILPFNFPMQLAARDLAAAICVGNTVVLKPPEQAPLAALALAELCAEAGAPAGVVNAVTGLGAEAGEALVRHDGVAHITFTGSVPTARRVLAAAAEGIKPTTIELGGKSPHIVFANADHERAIAAIVATTYRTAGQACSAGTRVLVERSAQEAFVDALGAAVAALRVGPAETDPDVGPLISEKQRDSVVASLANGIEKGARVITGGGPPPAGSVPAGGFYVAPTLIADVESGSPLAQEEVFGPVVAVTSFDDEHEAAELANGTGFGLVAGVWTSDVGTAHRLARVIDAGQIFVNSYGVGGGVELPFGGYKRSGFGRIKGIAGALEYTQIKNVYVAHG
jgi:acyl-CoA reductase-like NAD-dependent aldehyde dehydrogenase